MNQDPSPGLPCDQVVDLIQSALAQPASAIAYHAGRTLRDVWPEKVILECTSCGFDLDGFIEAGHAAATELVAYGHNQMRTTWRGCREEEGESTGGTDEEGILLRPINAFLRIDWQGHTFEALRLSWVEFMRPQHVCFLIGSVRTQVEAFYSAVCAWTGMPHGEVLVFDQGSWRKDRRLYESIHGVTFESLVLAPGLKEQLCADITGFFARREVYARYGVPWKRGILLLGPPGNGKTHAVKALCRSLGVPVLYLRSLEPAGMFHGSEHANISQVFDLARRTAPCLLILEDLDALIKPTNRSVFLNELDGFAQNTGICVVATTNYPERLDPAILERPSRFDRKYTFDLPGPTERCVYLELWTRQQTPNLRLSTAGIQTVAQATEGFSFAYLKELCLAASMAWINAGPDASMDTIALAQAQALEAQRRHPPSEAAPAAGEPTRAERIRELFGGGG